MEKHLFLLLSLCASVFFKLPMDSISKSIPQVEDDDSCAFGAEVFVIKCTGGGECLSVIKELLDNTYTCEIKNFPEVEDTILHSNAFFVGNHEWKLLVYPKETGNGEGNNLSLFLELADCGTIPSKPALDVEFFLRVKGGLHGEYYQRKAHSWFCTKTESWSFHKMVSLAELHDKSKGFIVEGTLEVEVQIDVMAVVKDFSKS